ncbi:hypothetical protein N781_01785 [Pontibacillus halophilus JSM 076056 = DSM 19796]|uniref:VanZ-like domain-containing protein n=1 Tax=Pontibacillus halophilus JSM 076056 = DSM 19796 TaxID=1385510 RepID=A0A0A5GRZ6_9BACI|nr:VanZ family protein [Pontibacillus halophilus]KGX93935.1 hypothetical protein N781_01785 [Pontibacillus halophilus JSM 076056 = DSM 19796]
MRKWTYWCYPALWMLVIFYSSSTPYQDQSMKPFLSEYVNLSFLKPVLEPINFTYHHTTVSVESLGVNGVVEFIVRKGAHFVSFGLLALLLYIAVKKSGAVWSIAFVSSLTVTLMYAIFDEVHQGFTPNRTPFYGDVIIDVLGALFIIGCIVLGRKR